MEQHQTSMWLFYAIGYIGLFGRVIWESLKLGRQVSVLVRYIKANSLVIIYSLFCYNAVLVLWMWSDLLSIVGFFKGELNGATMLGGFLADILFNKAVARTKSKSNEISSDDSIDAGRVS